MRSLPVDINIAVLITCFNRVGYTINCLENLYKSRLPSNFTFQVYLVDDGSTDETSQIIKTNYPEIVLLNGSGNLYWSGGMRYAWLKASENNYDYFLWLNNDTMIYEDSLYCLLKSSILLENQSIICGTTISKHDHKITYGGRLLSSNSHIVPNGELVPCELVNGNFVLIPKRIYKVVGNIDSIFIHAFGDHDYGLRVLKNGFGCNIAPKIIGECEGNSLLPQWANPDFLFLQRLKFFFSPLGNPPYIYFRYNARHFGFFIAIKQLMFLHFRLFFPKLWQKLKNYL